MKIFFINLVSRRKIHFKLSLLSLLGVLMPLISHSLTLIDSFTVHSELRMARFVERNNSVFVASTTGIHEMIVNDDFSYKDRISRDRVLSWDLTTLAGQPYQVIGTKGGFIYYQGKSLIYVHKLEEPIRWLEIAEPPVRYLAGTDHSILVKNALTATDVVLEMSYPQGVASVALSKNGGLAAIGTVDGILNIINVNTGEPQQTLDLQSIESLKDSIASSLKFSDDQSLLLVGGNNGHLSCLNVEDWSVLWESGKSDSALSQIYIDGANDRGFSLSEAGNIQSWNLGSGNNLHEWKTENESYIHFDYDLSSDRLMAVGTNQSVTFWNASTGSELAVYDATHASTNARVIELSDNNEKVIIQGAGNHAQVWDLASRTMIREVQVSEKRSVTVSASLLANGNLGLFNSSDSTWPNGALFRPSANHKAVILTETGESLLSNEVFLDPNLEDTLFLDLSPDGEHLLIYKDGLYELNLSNPLRSDWIPYLIDGDADMIKDARYSPGGRFILVNGAENESATLLIEIETSRRVNLPYRKGNPISISPDSSKAITRPINNADGNPQAILWDLDNDTSKPLVFHGLQSVVSVSDFEFINDSSNLVIAETLLQNDLRGRVLYNIETDEIVHHVSHSDFHPNNSQAESKNNVFYIGNDRLWDLENGVLLEDVAEEIQGATSFTFFNDSRHLLMTKGNRVDIYAISDGFRLPSLQYDFDPVTGMLDVLWESVPSDFLVLQQTSSLGNRTHWRTVEDGSALKFKVDTFSGNSAYFRLHWND